MQLLEKIEIQTNSDLIFLKHTLLNYTNLIDDESFYIFVAMELGTNLLKHSNGGYFYLLQKENKLIIASLDYGKGIDNIDWALSKGTSSFDNSLGVGLYQLNHNENYKFEIFSLTQEIHGTICIVYPKTIDLSFVYFSEPFLNQKNNGDFFAKKGKFYLFGDASGHTIKAKKTADYIMKQFFNNLISCVMIEEFFNKINSIIIQRKMRSAVFCIIESIKDKVKICGVGNIDIWNLDKTHKYYSLKDGIVGEVYNEISNINIDITNKLFFTTDGIRKKQLISFINQLSSYSALMCVLATIHFAGDNSDDKSVLVIRTKNDKRI